MKVTLLEPIETIRGTVERGKYYFRMYKGIQIVQRCPDRSRHVKTAAEKANQQRFARQYAGKRIKE